MPSASESTDLRPTIIVVGNGMVGHKLCVRLRQHDPDRKLRIVVFGEEPRAAYDRVRLTEYFDHEDAAKLSLAEPGFYEASGIELRTSSRVAKIDRVAKEVVADDGSRERYDRLVLATGSAPFVPPLPGIDTDGVFVYRTIEDLEAIIARAASSSACAVLGGGLLGLEAARAVQMRGLRTHVVELAPRLMPRQLDAIGARLLQRAIVAMNVEVHLGAKTEAVLGEGCVTGLALTGSPALDVDIVVVSAGIRPRDELAREAGLEVGPRGGIVVDDGMATSDPDILAVGEVALHRGMIYGLVAPGYDMADVAAKRLAGQDARFEGGDLSAKLKLMGVDVASFGDPFADEPNLEVRTIAFQDHVKGVYKKLLLDPSGKRLLGGILVGDASDYATLHHLYRSGEDLGDDPDALILGERGGAGGGKRDLPDAAQVCSCNNVSKGDICARIRADGLTQLGEVKKCTTAGTGCGGCVPVVEDILRAELAKSGKAQKPRICEHFEFTRAELYEIVRITGIRTLDELLAKHGRGRGCEICRPAVASIFASTHNDPILDHASLQDTNDRFLANIQRKGTYSVIPRVPGGEITPEKLIVLGEVAKKYDLYAKITGGQRIDLLGARVEQLPDIWRDLVRAGFESGHAYGKALRTVKSCIGSTWCRYGVQDSTAFAIRVEERYKGLRAPHKIKSAVSGCIRECAEAQGKDFGIIATEKGWNLYVCGNGGAKPRHADLLASDVDDETCIRLIDRFLMFYIRTADRLTRTSVWLDKMEGGIEHLRDVVVNDTLSLAAELEAQMQGLVDTYACEWTEVVNDPVRAKAFRHFVNDPSGDPEARFVIERGQKRPVAWVKKTPVERPRVHLPIADRRWIELARVEDVPRDGGVAVRYGNVQLAVYHYAGSDRWYATQNMCPHMEDMVLARGLLGDQGGVPKVACPLHKKTFSLEDGRCLSGDDFTIATFPARVENGRVYAELPPAESLESALCPSNHCHADAAE